MLRPAITKADLAAHAKDLRARDERKTDSFRVPIADPLLPMNRPMNVKQRKAL
jgi:hypothetical protein